MGITSYQLEAFEHAEHGVGRAPGDYQLDFGVTGLTVV